MDLLALPSILARVRNPQGYRRWAYRQARTELTPLYRVKQVRTHATNYARNNSPLLSYEIPAGTLANLEYLTFDIVGRDLWERPAKRWFDVNVTGAGVNVGAVSGQPFVVTDPEITTVKYTAQIGDSVELFDKITGATFKAKIKTVNVVTGNQITINPDTGSTLPPNTALGVHEYKLYHELDAFQIELTVVHTRQVPELATYIVPKLRLIYYRENLPPLVQDYDRITIESINAAFGDVQIKGDQFGGSIATDDYQVVSLFRVPLARAPDEVQLVFTNNRVVVTGTPNTVRLGPVAAIVGDYTNALLPVRPNILDPQAPIALEYATTNLPLDVEDYYTGQGDIVMVPAGSGCPPGYENVAQLDTGINTQYLQNPGAATVVNGRTVPANPLDPLFSTLFNVTVSGGASKFVSVTPLPLTNFYRSTKWNTASWQIVWIDTVSGKKVRNAARIPQLLINDPQVDLTAPLGSLVFTLNGDYAHRNSIDPTQLGYIYIGGLFARSTLAEANQYRKPRLNGEDCTPGEDATTQAALTNNLRLPSQLLASINVGDQITFTNSDREPLATRLAFGAPFNPLLDTTGPTYIVTAINADGSVTVVNAVVGVGIVTDVRAFVLATDGNTTTPLVSLDNFFYVELTDTAHTHDVLPADDAEEKARQEGGHYVTYVNHFHNIVPQNVIPPYRSYCACAKL